MKFTKHQKAIIRKISSGEITDIPSYIKAFNLSTFHQLNKEDIKSRMLIEENGKTYRKLKDGVETIRTTTSTNNALGFPMPSFIPNIPKDEDFEYVPATISYHGSSQIVEIDASTKFEFNFFNGISTTNSFSVIKDFLTIWQFLKSQKLVLEVGKKITKSDYEPFFEYKPISETKYGKSKGHKQSDKEKTKTDAEVTILDGKILKKIDFPSIIPFADSDCIKDYRNYIDYNFEYNKANELICSQFINKQIYGNSELDIFIKKRFKTNDEININKTLIPAYLALVLTLIITIWQNFFNDNSAIITIQNQLIQMQQTLDEHQTPNLTNIENKLQKILDSPNITSINAQLEEILQEIKKDEQTP